MAISNEQPTRDQNKRSSPFYFVPSSLAVQCLGVRCRLRRSPIDRYNDLNCSKRLCLPLHPQRPVCLESKYYLHKYFCSSKHKAFKNIHWSYLSFNLRNAIAPVNIWEIEICERVLDWKAIVKQESSKILEVKYKRVCFEFWHWILNSYVVNALLV